MKLSDLTVAARSERLIVFLVFMFPLFCLGVFGAVGSGFDYWAFRETSEHGAEAKAEVHILQEADGGYTTDISWIDQSGTRRSVRMALSKEYVLNNKARLIADGVTVRYLVNNDWAMPVVVGDEDQSLGVFRTKLKFTVGSILASLAVGTFGLFAFWVAGRLWKPVAARIAAGQNQRRAERWAEEAHEIVERLPFETVMVSGNDAFATWERLRAEGRGYPVVLGNEQEAAGLLQTHAMEQHARMAAAEEVFEKAQGLHHPADLQAKQRVDAAQAHERIRSLAAKNPKFAVPTFISVDAQGRKTKQPDDETRAWLLQEPKEDEPPLGEWPEQVEGEPGLSVVQEIVSGEQDGQRRYHIQKIKERVVVALLPVSHSYEVLGYLLYGNWNACPPADYHVAAQRSWSERYGAEIVGVTRDTLNIRVARKPETRDEALELAREHHIYCNDVIDQGTGTLSNLAAQLMQHEWWYFWWD